MDDSLSGRLRKRKTATTAIVVVVVVASMVAVGVGVALASGGKQPELKPDPKPDPKPDVPPKVEDPKPQACAPGFIWDQAKKACVPVVVDPPKPDPPKPDPEPEDIDPNPPAPPADPPEGDLAFDLSNNWGGIPLELRRELARMELASQIPGLARALAVKAWQAFRAKQPFVDKATAAKIAAASPQLCRNCFNPGDGASSKKLLDANIAQGWPKPTDYDGWAAGSYGLFDILGAVAVHAGVHTDPKGSLPLVTMLHAADAMKRYDVQGFAASYIVRRLMYSEKYKVLVPGVQAPANTQDPKQTWGNIFSAYAAPDDFSKGTQAAKDRKSLFLARADEIGIDLAKVAYPWPPGITYKAPTWTAGQVWKRLQDYKSRGVYDNGGQSMNEGPTPPMDELMLLANGMKAKVFSTVDPNVSAPLVVVLHGADADEQQLLTSIDKDADARFVFLRGLVGDGPNRWYKANHASDPVELVPQLDLAAKQVLTAINELALTFDPTKIFVVGYSQGASVALNLAAKAIRPENVQPWQGKIDGVIALGGFLPEALYPKAETPTRVWAVHGAQDKAVPMSLGEKAVDSFMLYAPEASLRKVAGGHALSSLRPQLKVLLSSLLASPTTTTARKATPHTLAAMLRTTEMDAAEAKDAAGELGQAAVEAGWAIQQLQLVQQPVMGRDGTASLMQTMNVRLRHPSIDGAEALDAAEELKALAQLGGWTVVKLAVAKESSALIAA